LIILFLGKSSKCHACELLLFYRLCCCIIIYNPHINNTSGIWRPPTPRCDWISTLLVSLHRGGWLCLVNERTLVSIFSEVQVINGLHLLIHSSSIISFGSVLTLTFITNLFHIVTPILRQIVLILTLFDSCCRVYRVCEMKISFSGNFGDFLFTICIDSGI
jgi:hypothetical protein